MEVSTTPFQLTTKVWFSGRNAGFKHCYVLQPSGEMKEKVWLYQWANWQTLALNIYTFISLEMTKPKQI